MSPSGGEPPEQVAMVISEVFRDPVPDAPRAGSVMLFTRALGEYLARQRARAAQDLDRLYALDPGLGGPTETKAAIQAGTHQLTS
jgi:hypothetical protein